MNKLDRKLIRDLIQMKGQVLAISLVIAAGVAVFTMSLCAYASLKEGQRTFYREFLFADVFASARRCPDSLIPRLESIPGIADVETRLVYDVLLNVPGMAEPATARLISVPQSGQSALNQIYISQGRMLEPGRAGEVVVSEMFAEAHGFRPGDRVAAILNGKLQPLQIVGIALSPEYIIQIQGGSILPDKKRYGIFWMNHREMEAAFDMSGAFNNVSAKLAHESNIDDVLADMDQLLEPFGGVGAYDRDENISHQFVNDELHQLRTMATIAPTIFLSVAAFLLNIVVTRIISQQREQIAALKAFGYTNLEIGSHYLNLVLLVSTGGTALGIGVGIWMATNLTEMYQEFYKFPVLTTRVNLVAITLGFLLTTLVAVISAWLAVRRAVKLPPAEAMRPEPPPNFRPRLIEKLLPTQLLPAELRMVLRNVQRKPFKSMASIFGIGMSVAVLIVGSFSLDSLDYLIEFQFRKAQRQDLTVTFVEPATASVIYELSTLRGVLDSETIRGIPSRVRFGPRSRRVGITGLMPEPKLFRLLNAREEVVAVPDQGIMLNSQLAKVLGCRVGDLVTVEVLDGQRPELELEVTALVDEFGGLNAYMSKAQVHQIMGESNVATGAFLKVDPQQLETIYEQLQVRPGVAAVSIKDATIASFMETVAKNINTMRFFNISFAVIIAIGVVYNSARISVSEQSRDLATMRVIGFSETEVSTVLLGEITLFTLLALPIGCLIGSGLAWILILGLATENYRIPLVIDNSTFAFACAIVLAATLVSGVFVQRRIARLDLVAALKTRD